MEKIVDSHTVYTVTIILVTYLTEVASVVVLTDFKANPAIKVNRRKFCNTHGPFDKNSMIISEAH